MLIFHGPHSIPHDLSGFYAKWEHLVWVSQSTARHSVERKVTEEEQLHTTQCSWLVSLEEAAGSSIPPGLQAVFSWIARALQQSPAWCGAAAPLAPTSKYVGQSTEKSTGLLVGIDEIPPRVPISPVPMMAPEWLWTLSIYLFLWKGTGNIPYSLESHKCNSFLIIVLNKHKKKVEKRAVLTLLQPLIRKLFSLDGGTKPLCGISLEVSSFPQRRKSTNQIQLLCEAERCKNSWQDPGHDSSPSQQL